MPCAICLLPLLMFSRAGIVNGSTSVGVEVLQPDLAGRRGEHVHGDLAALRRRELGTVGGQRLLRSDRRTGDDVVEQDGLDRVDAERGDRGEQLPLVDDPLPGQVVGKDAEGAVGGDEGGDPGPALREDAHRRVRLGTEHCKHGLGDDVEVAGVVVEPVAVGGEDLGQRAVACGGSTGWGSDERDAGGEGDGGGERGDLAYEGHAWLLGRRGSDVSGDSAHPGQADAPTDRRPLRRRAARCSS